MDKLSADLGDATEKAAKWIASKQTRKRGSQSSTEGSASEESVGPLFLGKYIHQQREQDFLGHGMFGRVWKATLHGTQTPVAIKIINLRRLNEKQCTIANVKEEINIMRSVMKQYTNGNPNIIRLYDVHHGPDEVSLVMEFCPGGELAKMITQKGRLNMETASRFLRQMSTGLQFLHGHSPPIIHRDLKPENMLLTSSDPETAVVKIADFGLARELKKTDLSNTLCGSPLFMAPEMLLASSHGRVQNYVKVPFFTASVDLFSLGAILYNMVTGRIEKECFYDEIIHGRPPRLDLLDPEVDANCRDVLEKLLDLDPNKRITNESLLAHPFLQPPVPSMGEDGDDDHKAPATADEGSAHEGEDDDLSDDWETVEMDEAERISSLQHAALPIDAGLTREAIMRSGSSLIDEIRSVIKEEGSAERASDVATSVRSARSARSRSPSTPSPRRSATNLTLDNRIQELKSKLAEKEQELAQERRSFETIRKENELLRSVDALVRTGAATIEKPPVVSAADPAPPATPQLSQRTSSVMESGVSVHDREELLTASPCKIVSPHSTPLADPVTNDAGFLSDSSVVHAHLLDDQVFGDKKPESPMVLVESPPKPTLPDEETLSGEPATNQTVVACKIVSPHSTPLADPVTNEAGFLSDSSVVHAHLLDDQVFGDKKPESPMVLVESPPKPTLSGDETLSGRPTADWAVAATEVIPLTQWNVKYKNFEENDLIMFTKDPDQTDVYNAFYHGDGLSIFLDMDSCKAAFCKAYGGSNDEPVQLPSLLFGNMVMFQKDMVATANYNPYALANGSLFSTIIARPVLDVNDIAAVKEIKRQRSQSDVAAGTTLKSIEKVPQCTFAVDDIYVGTNNLFVVRGDDTGVYVMVRYDGEYDVPYFLSRESITAMVMQERNPPTYFLVHCVEIERRVAGANDEWGLKEGEEYGLVTGEWIP